MRLSSILFIGAAAPAFAKLFKVPSGTVAKVSIIDTTVRVGGAADFLFVTPKLEGFDVLPNLTSLSFLIESPTGKKAVFDLAVPFDPLNSYAPAVVEQLQAVGFNARVDKHVADILKDGGVNLKSINSVIWSHYHYDHIGDIRTFPLTTEIVVGPGFSKAYLPGYPTNPNSTLRDSYFESAPLPCSHPTRKALTQHPETAPSAKSPSKPPSALGPSAPSTSSPTAPSTSSTPPVTP